MLKIGRSILLGSSLALLIMAGCSLSKTPLPTASPGAVSSPTAGEIQAATSPAQQATPVPSETPAAAPTRAPVKPMLAFASYPLEPVAGRPALQQDAIDPQMGNVLVPLALTAEQVKKLAEAGVVASPADYPEFHDVYKESAQNNLPVFVTSDALLHAYHLTFDQLLSSLEEDVFLLKLRELNAALLVQAQSEYEQLKGTVWEEAAQRALAYLAVGGKLADPDFQLPEAVKDLAQAELELIDAASGAAPSPIFTHLKHGEDYSQYVPRGHYTKSEALKTYFRAMMWYGRMTFRIHDTEDAEAGPAESRMALLLTLALRDARTGSQPALELWKLLYDPTAFLVGRSDDLTVEDYLAAMEQVYGPGADLNTIADDARLPEFLAAASELPAPRILGLISDDYKPMEAVKGLRLMGQRFVPDAYIFQELIHPKVPQRFLPSGLDVMAVMGSERAASWLERDPTAQNEKYASQLDKMTGWLGGLSQQDWIETSYNAWLYTLRGLLEPAGEGYPLFMQSTAWGDKQLNTALGSWSELKHDTLLYAKQPYGGLGGCGWPAPPAPVRAQNYVEPVPEVFARIAALAEMTRQGLEERGLLQLIPVEDQYALTTGDRLDAIATKAKQLKAMAEKELQGQPLSDDEQESLRAFGEYMEEVVIWASGEKQPPDPAAIIADVATDPNKGKVLEAGIGDVHELYVVAPIPQADGLLALTVARGGIFSYYEFPSKERLTDENWRKMLKDGKEPDQPAFTTGFSVPQSADPQLQAAIYRFQRDWADWLYLTVGYSGEAGCAKTPEFLVPVDEKVLGQAKDAIAALQAQNQYEGRQWINTDYLGVEPSNETPGNVVATVRETWQDYLVTYEGTDPFAWFDGGQPEVMSARRGPYTVDVVYELQPLPGPCNPEIHGFGCYAWKVVRFEELTERPAWGTP